jgi:hypothetical protein
LLQSNQFDTTWSKNNTTLTSGQSGYDGSSDAWKLEATANGGSVYISNAVSLTSIKTCSVYAKAGSYDYVIVQCGGGTASYTWFDLTNGAVGTEINVIDSKIESIGNGWYRCSITAQGTHTGATIYAAPSDGGVSVVAGNYIYIQDAQLESTMVATDYIETGASTAQSGILEDLPRLDYSGGASCPSLLLEPQRTNSISNSEYFNAWTKEDISITSNAAISPQGVQNASKLIPNTALNDHTIYQVISGSGNRSFSVFAKAAGYDFVFVGDNNNNVNDGAIFNLAQGTIALNTSGYNASIEDFGNGWYRCSIYGNFSSIYSCISPAEDGTTFDFAGDGTSGVYVYGAQWETGSYPTSYIPTMGSAVTRSGDSCQKTGATDLIGQEQGTMFVEAKTNFDFQGGRLLLIGQTNNFIELVLRTTGKINAFVWNGAAQADFNSSSTYSTGDTLKIALAYKENDFVLYINGVQEGSDTSGVIPNAMAQIIINNYTAPNYNSANAYKQATLFKTRLTNAELAALTTI